VIFDHPTAESQDFLILRLCLCHLTELHFHFTATGSLGGKLFVGTGDFLLGGAGISPGALTFCSAYNLAANPTLSTRGSTEAIAIFPRTRAMDAVAPVGPQRPRLEIYSDAS
jgi:hypothetical protein